MDGKLKGERKSHLRLISTDILNCCPYLSKPTIVLRIFLRLRIVDGLKLVCCHIDLSDVDVVQHNNSISPTAPPAL